MTFVVGSASLNVGGSYGPAGILHGVRLEEAYNGVALCGTEVYAWPDIDFPTGRPRRECPICRDQSEAES